MQRVLKDIAINAREITFSCVYFNEKRSDAFLQKNELFEKFKHIADELKYKYEPDFVKTNKKGDFYAMQNYLFAMEKHKVKPFGNLQVFEADSKKREIDFVANTILCGVQNGKRFSDYGVFVTDENSDIKILKDCFDVYKIPYFVSTGKQFDGHFLIGLIKSAFDVVRTNFSSEKVLKFMSNPLFDAIDYPLYLSFVNETGTNYSEFLGKIDENYLASHKTYYEKLSERLEDEENTDFSNKLSVLNKDHNKMKNFFGDFIAELKTAKTVNDYIKIIEKILETFKISTKLVEIAENQRQMNLQIEAEITLKILPKLEKYHISLSQFLGETEMSAQEFLQVYLSGVSAAKITLAPVSIDCVIIQSNTDGFYDLKNMFIVGATDGKFPGKINDSGIILDDELEETKNLVSKTVEPTVKQINRRETFRIYEALLEPTEKLYISYSLKGEGGQTNRPEE